MQTMRPDIEAIQARAEAATAMPWKAWDHREQFGHLNYGVSGQVTGRYGPYESNFTPWTYADAEFIAAARQDVPALLAYIAGLEDTTQKLNGLLVVISETFPEVFEVLHEALEALAGEAMAPSAPGGEP